jgi:hypothetical protein
MRLILQASVFAVGVSCIIGCAGNPYAKFYRPSAPPDAFAKGDLERATAPPQVFSSSPQNKDEDLLAMVENGFLMVGWSSFNWKQADVSDAIEEARAIGASLVVLYSQYSNTISGTVPLVLPKPPERTTSTSSGTIIGTGGSASYMGTSESTTTGGYNVIPIPYNQMRYDQLAVFYAKSLKKVRFGAYARDLTPDERARLGRNRGAVLIAVLKGSPAFRADFLRGDVIIKMGDDEIDDYKAWMASLDKYTGSDITVKFIRGTETMLKEIKLNK